MGCCASLIGCYKPTDSVVVVVSSTLEHDATQKPSTTPKPYFPPPHELYGLRALESEVVHLLVKNTPGKIVKRRFRNGMNYSHHQVEVAACSHIVVTDRRLLILFKPFYGGAANLVAQWDHPHVRDIHVEVVEDKRPSGRDKSKTAADLLVLRWDHGAVMQLPNCSGQVEARLRTPHAKLIQDAIFEQQKKKDAAGGPAAS